MFRRKVHNVFNVIVSDLSLTLLYLQTTPQNSCKMHLQYLLATAMSWIVYIFYYCFYPLTFGTFLFVCTFFLHLRTVFLRYLCRHVNIPKLSKKLHHHMTECCAKLNINLISLFVSKPFLCCFQGFDILKRQMSKHM